MTDALRALPPADEMEAAAALITKRLKGVTPGPWWRPLDVRNKAVVAGFLPEGETGRWISGFTREGTRERVGVVQVNTWSSGEHARPGYNGRDLEWAALMNPDMGPILRAILLRTAAEFRKHVIWETLGNGWEMLHRICGSYVDRSDGCECFAEEIALARFLLVPRNEQPEGPKNPNV